MSLLLPQRHASLAHRCARRLLTLPTGAVARLLTCGRGCAPQVALLGDLAVNLTGVGQLFNQKPAVVAFVREAEQSADSRLADSAEWANNVITKAMSG